MPDEHQTPTDAVDDGELLAAYLDGETDDVTTARLERRLADDPALAGRLDAIADVRVRMQRLVEVSAPDAARRRLWEELGRVRAGDDVTDPTPATDGTGAPTEEAGAPTAETGAPSEHRPWWSRRPGAVLAAAALVLIAVFGAATLLQPISGAGDEALVAEDDAVGEAGGAEADTSPQLEEEAAEAAGDAAAPQTATSVVSGDSEIAARARELRDDPPDDLRARERRLRDRAGLPTERLCVTELDATTVDLVDEDGRVTLAVLLSDVDQIVLLDTRTCAAIRTIPASR
jgi:hypothetical protein